MPTYVSKGQIDPTPLEILMWENIYKELPKEFDIIEGNCSLIPPEAFTYSMNPEQHALEVKDRTGNPLPPGGEIREITRLMSPTVEMSPEQVSTPNLKQVADYLTHNINRDLSQLPGFLKHRCGYDGRLLCSKPSLVLLDFTDHAKKCFKAYAYVLFGRYDSNVIKVADATVEETSACETVQQDNS